MPPFKTPFIQFCLEHKVLQWGSFTLKSGRKSPYFFNVGALDHSKALHQLGLFYAQAILEYNLSFDLLLGLAYKGIPIVCATAIALVERYNINKPYVFNRKALKEHGEKGLWVGSPPKGHILLLDDVVTAGTALSHILPHLPHQAHVDNLLIALDRQEYAPQDHSKTTTEWIQTTHGIHTHALITLSDMITYLDQHQHHEQRDLLLEHQRHVKPLC